MTRGIGFAQNSLFFLNILTILDNRIDAYPPTNWIDRFGEPSLGKARSAFLNHFLDDEIDAIIDNYSNATGIDREDVIAVLNVFGFILTRISEAATRYSDSAKRPEDKQPFVEANNRLFVFSTVCLLHKPPGLLRRFEQLLDPRASIEDWEAIYERILEAFPKDKDYGLAIKLVKDIRNWAAELRMEVEHGNEGFYKSNAIVEEYAMRGGDLKELYSLVRTCFDSGSEIPFDGLPRALQGIIDSRLNSYSRLRKYALVYRMFGIKVRPDSFATDLKDLPYGEKEEPKPERNVRRASDFLCRLTRQGRIRPW